ncbi:MAG: hypothetical protein J6A42_06870 [Firmicutes bacterium]|nr:hypothetical protein [Bacillota bacterium]
MTIDVYRQYFEAECTFAGVPRRAALVTLTSDSEAGQIRYTAAAAFFPHTSEDDFGVSYDAFAEAVLYEAKGRRSKKREAQLMEQLQAVVDEAAAALDAKVFWDKPLREAQFG